MKDQVYLGGPVDFAEHELGRDWRHWPGWGDFGYRYCPKCECEGLDSDAIVSKNYYELLHSRFAVLDLRSHSIGTPIEFYWRVFEDNLPTILIVKPGSVFVKFAREHFPGVTAVSYPQEALEYLRENAHGARREVSS